MRINKYLATAGIGSRRHVEQLVTTGRIKVNGEVVTNLATDIKDDDLVLFDNRKVSLVEGKEYYLLNKPLGFLTTASDDRGRPTVMSLMRGVKTRLFPVGRLDYNTTGMLILTNDGEFTFEVTHPKSHIKKTYEVVTKFPLRDYQVQALKNGMVIDDYLTMPAQVDIGEEDENHHFHTFITICEGHNRQIRKCFEVLKLPIIHLSRVKIGSLTLDGLPLGKYRKLELSDLEKVREK